MKFLFSALPEPIRNSKCVSVLGQYKCNSSSLLNHRLIHVTFLTCQTFIQFDFTTARIAPILISTCQTGTSSDFFYSKLAGKTSKIAKKKPSKTAEVKVKNSHKNSKNSRRNVKNVKTVQNT